MEVAVERGNIAEWPGEAVVVNLFEGVTAPGGATGAVDRALGGAVSQLIADGEIRGKRGEMTVIHTLGGMPPKRVVVAGLGPSSDYDLDAVRATAADSCRHLRGIGVRRVATIAHGAGIGGLDAEAVGQAMVEGALLGLYRFDRHKSSGDDDRQVEGVTIVEFDAGNEEALRRGAERGVVIAEAVNLCRDMANEPANHMTPTRMAEEALEVARGAGLEVEALERPRMEELSMGALLGVAQGSEEPPKLIVMRYRGDPDDEANSLGLLGQGHHLRQRRPGHQERRRQVDDEGGTWRAARRSSPPWARWANLSQKSTSPASFQLRRTCPEAGRSAPGTSSGP